MVYATSSSYKLDENGIFVEHATLPDGSPVRTHFRFDIRRVSIKETLEIAVGEMVRAEAARAYASLKVPCVVEHAGLIYQDYLTEPEDKQYPGGLTKPMWNSLGERFLDETHARGRSAVARAVVGYCDGQSVRTFVGETAGTIADRPRGERRFYWDTVFIPDREDGTPGDKTYAEIVADPDLGLVHKVVVLSQSSKAMLRMLEWMQGAERPFLWPDDHHG
ncbi:MAG TPA: non-canonical purine NTP pyrophosphatase [Conexibacter sp.]|nr:non-canonical purine NTP pyrophosphatase [Conexibacter sp.]